MLSDNETIRKIEEVLAPILVEEQLDLVDMDFRPSGKRWLLRVFIDKAGGVTIKDCEYVSRELSRVLDVEDFVEHPYTLEVSSPGLTRPLTKRADFERYVGRLCKIVTKEKVDDMNEFTGNIVSISEDKVEIKGKLGVFAIPICAIKKAHLEYEP
jgi:ribosome maturation factor RimP